MVPPVQHYGALAVSEREASCHLSVHQGGGEKVTSDGGRGSEGECKEGLSGLHNTARDGYLLQISGVGLDGGVQRLSGSSGGP